MSPNAEEPCLKRIDKHCFDAHPNWAKQAFAYRLLHALVPQQITQRLPAKLRLPLLPPGVIIPGSENLPPGTVIPPGGSIPPDYSPGDQLPPGIIPPPTQPPTTGPLAPPHLTPDPAGPLPVTTGKTNPPPGPGWVSILDDTYWTAVWTTGGLPVWTGTVWDCPSTRCRLLVNGTWAVDYRPTHIRITCQDCATCHFNLSGALGDITIVDDPSYTSGTELELDFSEGWDIDYFYIYNAPGPNLEVSNIEFKQAE